MPDIVLISETKAQATCLQNYADDEIDDFEFDDTHLILTYRGELIR